MPKAKGGRLTAFGTLPDAVSSDISSDEALLLTKGDNTLSRGDGRRPGSAVIAASGAMRSGTWAWSDSSDWRRESPRMGVRDVGPKDVGAISLASMTRIT
jgi:hypothetical protein